MQPVAQWRRRPRLRSLARGIGLTAVVCTTVSVGLTSAAAAPATAATAAAAAAPDWMVTSSAIGLIDAQLGSSTLSTQTFDVRSTLEIGNPEPGWTTQRVEVFKAYGPATTAGSFLYALGHDTIPAGTTAVAYDPESWSFTPPNEQVDAGAYMAAFVATAHEHGYKAILAPSLDLTSAMPCRAPKTPAWANYLRNCDVPALVAAAHPDVYVIQSQSLENDLSVASDCGCYAWFVRSAVAESTAVAPIGEVLAGLSTDPAGATTSGQALYTDTLATLGTVTGYWLNVPVMGPECPTCSPGGDPTVAADYLLMLDGASSSG